MVEILYFVLIFMIGLFFLFMIGLNVIYYSSDWLKIRVIYWLVYVMFDLICYEV